jgi:ribonuclease HII
VLLPHDYRHSQLTDSKLLSASQREQLRHEIERDALSYAVAAIDAAEIDRINILQAAIRAMHLALDALSVPFGYIIVDGSYFIPYRQLPHTTIVKGDSRYLSIAAASVLAKVYRDEYMQQAHEKYPHYGWQQNKGYGTAKHRAAMAAYGLSPLHRLSFKLKEQASTPAKPQS